MSWFSTSRSETKAIPHHSDVCHEDSESDYSSGGEQLRRRDSLYSVASFDWDDPDTRRSEEGKDVDGSDLEKDTLRQMDYKQRRKHIQRIRIRFNVSCKTFEDPRRNMLIAGCKR